VGELSIQDQVLVAELQRVLRDSNVPFRRPSNEQPTFWSYPVCETNIIPLANGGWTDILTLRGLPQFTQRVDKYVATTFGDQTLSGVEFRFVFNGTLAPNMALASGVDHNKVTPATFPVVFQTTSFLVEEKDYLILQARNTNVFQQLVCAALTGWRYNNPNSVDKTQRSVITDDT